MKQYRIEDRVVFYKQTFPKWPEPQISNDKMYGVWVIGNNYKGSGYYGSYPPTYLKRVMSMFPDADNILHLFSGSLQEGNYTRFDCNRDLNPDVVGDAHNLPFESEFDLIIADPPYSVEDAVHYGTPMVNRYKVIKQCVKALRPGGFIVWLDQVFPMFSKKEISLYGIIGIIRSTNHRVRSVFIFNKEITNDRI